MGTDIQVLPFNNWLNKTDEPFVIAGPCSAESEQQVMETAKQIAEIPMVKVFRAGIWKPRTRPGDFEGVGEEGLKWMSNVKKVYDLKTTVEIADPKHIELALKYDIDMFWIGARTVVNPFSVQSLADALQGVDVPVLVKNPINPDLKLWVGAIERINAAGINRIIAVHRGFHYFEKSPYRNAPMWEIPIELKRVAPSLPIIVDPSHIAGNRTLLQQVSQRAFDLEMDGLMVESHHDPSVAKTDAAQQLAPPDLKSMLESLIIREKRGDTGFDVKLEELRTEIDKIDGQLLQTLAKRLEIVDEIGEYKEEKGITILQMKRWAGIIEDRLSIGTHLGLSEKFLKELLALMHKESLHRQADIFNKARKKRNEVS
jgi:chorismate mutase